MAGYDEVLYVMFAMVIVSTMALNANRFIQMNNVTMIEGQLEGQIVAYAQDIIEESRALAFDEETRYEDGNSIVPVNIPGGFSTLGPDGTESSRDEFNDFDDYDGYTETVTITGVDYNVSVDVEYITTSDYSTYTVTTSKSTLKRIRVNIQTEFLTNNSGSENTNYYFEFIRSYYAD